MESVKITIPNNFQLILYKTYIINNVTIKRKFQKLVEYMGKNPETKGLWGIMRIFYNIHVYSIYHKFNVKIISIAFLITASEKTTESCT